MKPEEKYGIEDLVVDFDSMNIEERDPDFCDDPEGWTFPMLGSVYHKDYREHPEVEIFVRVDVTGETENDGEWEEDGPATYVPYGNQRVMLDDGKGGYEVGENNTDSKGIDDIIFYINDDYKFGSKITEERAKEILNIKEEDWGKLIQTIKEEASKVACDYANDYFDDEYWEEQAQIERDSWRQ